MERTQKAFRMALVTGCAAVLTACGAAIPSAQAPSQSQANYQAQYKGSFEAQPRQAAGSGYSKSPRSAPRPVAVSGSSRVCLTKLGQTGTQFQPLPDKYYGGGCTNLNTVKLSAIRGDKGEFGLSNAGPLQCDTANSFTAWARYGVDRAARQILGSPLERIETMGTYSCRNVAGSNKLSAHSTAAAVDVSAFVLADGRRISLAGDWDGGSQKERQFLRTVHRSACKRFGTVLGPEYNSAHRDHFHMERSNSNFCR